MVYLYRSNQVNHLPLSDPPHHTDIACPSSFSAPSNPLAPPPCHHKRRIDHNKYIPACDHELPKHSVWYPIPLPSRHETYPLPCPCGAGSSSPDSETSSPANSTLFARTVHTPDSEDDLLQSRRHCPAFSSRRCMLGTESGSWPWHSTHMVRESGTDPVHCRGSLPTWT
jgi:hypothetical protein